ncbi:hypothetical protein CR203_08210 [Salipaludibacillus neizhouensis]|uniref:Uncharacterized protein n=1 Tax=Salipaludibacillus neizhouensis TaxID=885475 RepID=A0A3A9K793_9BACI|nr:hypothetical protein [Salipaludibacillus neizhouensis]RKL67348.1 hypothetical protein CR203_08210 [Salipaludibacillus neizhouensis]
MMKGTNLKKLAVGIISAAVVLLIIILYSNNTDINTDNNSADSTTDSNEVSNEHEQNDDLPESEEESQAKDGSVENNETTDIGEKEAENENSENKGSLEEEDSVSEPNAEEVMAEYKETFLEIQNQAKENEGNLPDFESKQALTSHFKTIMSDDLANWYTDAYFKEEDGNVSLLPQDGPTWLKETEPYELEKVNDEEYHVIQEWDNELLGHRFMIYVLTYNGEKWIVEEIQSEIVEEE